MQSKQNQLSKSLWMNHRKIDEQGLIIPYSKQRQFNINECVNSLQNLLSKHQAQGLQIHYAQHFNRKDCDPADFQTITYRGYLVGRCPRSSIQEQKCVKGGQLRVEYRIVRLDKSKINCVFPYLLLFELIIQAFPCSTCKHSHFFRIYKSSFQAIRSEFTLQVSNKIVFMNKYPTYSFAPHNFQSKREHGLTTFLRLKYEDYQSAQYFEVSQEIVVNGLRIHCLKEGLDFEAMRLEDYDKLKNIQQNQEIERQFKNQELIVKIKYICCKCKQKVIWTTKSKVSFKYKIIKMFQFPLAQGKKIYNQDIQFIQFNNKALQKKRSYEQNMDQQYLHTRYKFQPEKLDKSLIREVEEYEEYKPYFSKFGRWHSSLQEYQFPFTVVVSLKVPRMACTGCGKEKDGLIYISNLINYSNNAINTEISKNIRQIKKKYAVKK